MRTVCFVTVTAILIAAGLGAWYGFLAARAFDGDLGAGSEGFAFIFALFGAVFGLLLGNGARNDRHDGL